MVFDGVFFVFVNDFSHFFNCVSGHLAEVVLDLEFAGVFFSSQGQVEVVFVVPFQAFESKFFFSLNLLGQDAFLSNYLQFIG